MEVDSRSAFTALINSQTTIDFESLPVTTNSYAVEGVSFSLGSVTFSDTANQYAVNGSGFGAGDGSTYLQGDGNGSEAVTLPTGAGGFSAVGSDIFNINGATTQTVVVTDSAGATLTLSAANTPPDGVLVPGPTGAPSVRFLGFVDTTPGATLSSITYTTTSDPAVNTVPALDNLSVGSVPEPASSALCGVAALALLNRRRRSSPSRSS